MRGEVETKLYVERRDFGSEVYVAIVREMVGSDVLQCAVAGEGGGWTYVDVPRHQQIPIFIKIPYWAAKQLLQGLIELNIPTPSAGAIEGELKATKAHLQDLRHLLKIQKVRDAP